MQNEIISQQCQTIPNKKENYLLLCIMHISAFYAVKTQTNI